MSTLKSPSAFLKTPEGRLTTFLLAIGVGASACSGASGNEATASSSASTSTSSTPTSSSAPTCHNGDIITESDGTKYYCEELQASSADVFRKVDDLNHTQVPGELIVGQAVLVRCVQAAALSFAPTAHGNQGDPYSEWYVLGPGPNENDYTASNDFWNVNDSTKEAYIKNNTPLNQQPAIDKNVPSCGPPILN